jgi:hypothetical protein
MSGLAKLENTNDLRSMGELMARSGFFADSRDAAQAAVKILAGQELGFGPFASMTGVHVIKGKCAVSANLLAAAVKRSKRYDFKVRKNTETEAAIEFFEGKEPLGVSTFTIEDAKTAGLTSNDTYKRFPRNMLYARAMSNGVRWFCPDLFGGPVYVPEELGAAVDGDGNVVAESPAVETPKALPAPASVAPAAPALSAARQRFGERFAEVQNASGIERDVLTATLFAQSGITRPEKGKYLTDEQYDELTALLDRAKVTPVEEAAQ